MRRVDCVSHELAVSRYGILKLWPWSIYREDEYYVEEDVCLYRGSAGCGRANLVGL
jgi:hypothetical protein